MSCVVCGEYCFKIVAFKNDIRWNCLGYNKNVVMCYSCGLIYLFPGWTQEELDKLYDGYLDKKDFSWQKSKVNISKYLTKYISKDDLVLEIGCGKGDNVRYLNNLGYYVKGIDKDPTYCDGLNTFHVDYKDHNCCVNFIYAIQIFEHIDDPEMFINKIIGMLNDKGKFLLEFPNSDDPILSIYEVDAFKKYYYTPHHLFYWSPRTVKMFFGRFDINIKVKLMQRYGILNHLRWVIFGVPGNWHPYIPILDDIYKFILIHIFKVSDTIIVIGEKKCGAY